MKGFIRPDAVVLPDNSVVPEKNKISPPPNQFTHELKRREPFYFNEARQAAQPDGHFPAGTKVVLMIHDGGRYCRVVDGQGLYVEVEHDALRRL